MWGGVRKLGGMAWGFQRGRRRGQEQGEAWSGGKAAFSALRRALQEFRFLPRRLSKGWNRNLHCAEAHSGELGESREQRESWGDTGKLSGTQKPLPFHL